jgi:hypothetical protein
LTLTHTHFLRAREIFYQTVSKSPTSCTLRINEVVYSDDYSDFIGDSPRKKIDFKVKCLFTRNITPAQRDKYGLSELVTALVYISPKSLEQEFGTWKINRLKTTVIFYEEEFVIEGILYQGEIYDNCVSIVLQLKTADRGGD